MLPPPGRQVLRFQVGGVRLAIPLSSVREIIPAGEGASREPPTGTLSLATLFGLVGEARFALLLEPPGPPALLVDRTDGVGDLAAAEVFQLPERTVAARPAPFASVLRFGEDLYLELAVRALPDLAPEPVAPMACRADAPAGERELLAERAGVRFAVPLPLVVQVIDPARLSPVPLAPPGLRGLLHHGRSLFAAWDAAALLGEASPGKPTVVLLLDAGGTTAGVLVDRVLGFSDGGGLEPVRRPPWDLLLSPGPEGSREGVGSTIDTRRNGA